VCTEDSKCAGWKVWGNYEVRTDENGTNSFTVHALAESPKEIEKEGQYGIGWGAELPEKDVETYAAVYEKGEWTHSTRYLEGTLDDLKDAKSVEDMGQASGDQGWTPVGQRVGKNTLSVKASRLFSLSEDGQGYKLGDKKMFAVGFFDKSGTAAFSDPIELTLDSGISKAQTSLDSPSKVPA